LDIKPLIRANEERENQERMGVRMPPPKKIQKTKQQIDYEYELAERAKYKLKRLENG
jgi:hypothetical protein